MGFTKFTKPPLIRTISELTVAPPAGTVSLPANERLLVPVEVAKELVNIAEESGRIPEFGSYVAKLLPLEPI
jgi:hypothetical protein